MLNSQLADKLVGIAYKQLQEGLEAKTDRMERCREYFDLYNNKTIEVEGDAGIYNAPFPYFANFVDSFKAKTDNPPTLQYKIPNKPILSDKVQMAWEQEKSSTHAGWNRKDRVEKTFAILTGRAVSKIYASSVGNRYENHYDIVDVFSFVADPTRGQLMDGNYHGETDIFKTHACLKEGADNGWYSSAQVEKLKIKQDDIKSGNQDVLRNKYDRLKALGVNVEKLSFVGQEGVMMTEWVMKYQNKWYYLLFDPKTSVWVRADELKNIFKSGKTPFVSWATHYDEFSFWSKSVADDIAPVTESMRFLINNAIENEKRRVRPMRMVDAGALVDVNELQDYVPDNVLLRNPGKDPNIITVETPEVSGTINLIEYLDTSSQNHSGLSGASVDEKDAKVGVFYGQLQQEADRIGLINKEYSESYAWKGYNYFWGLKQHLSKPKQIEMLGKFGVKLEQLTRVELSDVDDVDDVIVSGGSAQDELDAVQTERRMKVLSELTASYPDKLNPSWVIRTSLKAVDYTEDEIEEALDIEGSVNRELMEEADQAIQEILLNKPQKLNNGANVQFMQRIQDFITEELDWVKVDKDGNVTGIDKKKKEQAERLMAFMQAHQPIVIQNMLRKAREEAYKVQMSALGQQQEQPQGAQQSVDLPGVSKEEEQQSVARPFEGGIGTPGATASTSQSITNTIS